MRKFAINVNGNSYEVEVEEVGGSSAATVAAPVAASVAPAAPAAPKAAAPAAPKPAAAGGPAGATKITAPMPGTVLDVKVTAGQAVKKGDVVAILEAMKMENEIMAPNDGTVATVNASKGQQVNSGDLLVSLS